MNLDRLAKRGSYSHSEDFVPERKSSAPAMASHRTKYLGSPREEQDFICKFLCTQYMKHAHKLAQPSDQHAPLGRTRGQAYCPRF